MSFALPSDLAEALAGLSEGISRRALGASATQVSEAYRAKLATAGRITDRESALAYALSRMPATYAAVSLVFQRLIERIPDFSPASLADIGAGPGTASWAAVEAWPGLKALALVDHNAVLLDLARELAGRPVLAKAERRLGDISELADLRSDLVAAAYALTELPDARMSGIVAKLWAATSGVLAIVEPGRPRDYARLMEVRAQLLEMGATIVAPCPHARPCPLPENDWCHFSVRLPRSRDHMRLKSASVPFEDEKFSYLIVARPELAAAAAAAARVIKPPGETKFSVTLQLCAADGLRDTAILKRDGASFKAAKKLEWGDEAPESLLV